MNPLHKPALQLAFVVLFVLAAELFMSAQDGKLSIQASPKHAYVFVDGRALGESTHTFSLSPGEHKVDVANYGYRLASQTVSITGGQTTQLQINLTPISDMVDGPWGAMTIEGADHDAILLNGKTPDFFVGQGDEFNHEWWWKQELVVPPGAYQVTVLSRDKEIWSGSVEVPANQRVVVNVPKGVRKTVAWSYDQISLPRFTVGTASARVAVAKPTAQLAVTAPRINCGDTSQLKWSATDAAQVEIATVGSVASSGEQNVQPKETTSYELKAVGPGGTVTSSATINVNTAVQANLTISPAELRYKRVGDSVVEQGNPALNWSATNAASVSIDPIGTVSMSGSQSVAGTPRKTDPGPVDEIVKYTLTATNPCGGTATQTATLHIVGVIEAPDAGLAFNSVYFPTDVPESVDSTKGLVASQQKTLTYVAETFKEYLQHKPDAHLILTAYADERGPSDYNQDLSERRADVSKNFLIEQGVPADHIETKALGSTQNLSADAVKQLVEQNPDLSNEERQAAMAKMSTVVLANNRRVDITLSTTGQESARHYTFKAEDYSILVRRNVEKAGEVQFAAEKKKISD